MSLYDDTVSLVIFDCDGVLVDSEIIACQVHATELAKHGVPVTLDDLLERFIGVPEATMRGIAERWGDRLPDDYLVRVRALILEALDRDLRAIPGIGQVLTALPFRRSVASNSPMHRLELSLKRTGLYSQFDPHIFSAEIVGVEKPEPDLHLHVAGALNVPPAHCVVIEDSVAGIEAARAAGMRAIGFGGGSHCKPDHGNYLRRAGADAVINDMRALPTLFARGGRAA